MIKDNPARVDPPEYQDMTDEAPKYSHEAICGLLTDPIVLWEAIGPDSIQLPFPSPRGSGLYEQRQNAIQIERVEAAILLAIKSKDTAELGKILYDQAMDYAVGLLNQRIG